jgi:predicted Zn-dependent protease
MRHSLFARTRNRMLIIIGLTVTVMGCASTGVNKGDFNLVSYQEEWQLGAQLEQDIEQQLPVINDGPALAYLTRLGTRIVSQTELAQAPWEFHIVADPRINAFNIPGGHVYVNTGLFQAADNVAELTSVLAHEISHGVARHGTEQLSKAYGFNIVASLALGSNPPLYQQLVTQIVGAGTFAKFGRDAEREADELGVIYMYSAGYDPHGMVTMFQELMSQRQREPNSVEQFFASHPLTEERIRNVRSQIESLEPRPNLIMEDAEFDGIRRRLSRYNR